MAEKLHRTPTIYRGSSESGVFVWSPFVTKLEARLRFDDIKYRVAGGSPKSGPRGKIPYLEIGEQGSQEQLGDTTLIIRKLIDENAITDLNARLSHFQKAHDLAIRALLEDKVYFYGVREKWWDHYEVMRSNALGSIPWPVQWLVGLFAYRAASTMLHGQGTGRYTHEEVAVFKHEAWEGVNSLVSEAKKASKSGKGPFWILGGEEPTEADATLFGFIASALVCDAAPATRQIVQVFPDVVDYAERIYEKYFPDYQKWQVKHLGQ
ncbi:Fc.00g074800.m01.CDS01 [Cosmosporella sp. VM-42]